MNRRSFIGAVLGAPVLGWISKIGSDGEMPLQVIEPAVGVGYLHVAYPEDGGTGATLTYSDGDGNASTMWFDGEGWVP